MSLPAIYYDNQGNRIKSVINNTETAASYNSDDELISYGNNQYSYNQDGQLISKQNAQGVTSYSYDTFGNLKEVILPNNTKVTYIYNANNQRSAKLINNEIQEKYLWLNLTTLLAIYDKDDNLITRFYYLDDRVPYKVKHNNQIYYLSYNHIGSLKQVTDINGRTVKSIIYSSYGSIIEDMNYDSFGNIITSSNLNIPIGFAGGLYDKDTKLTKFGYREYDSTIGRWTSKDPIRYEGGDSNLYGYVLNDPVNFVDPTGEIWQIVLGGAAIAVTTIGYYVFGTYMKSAQDTMPKSKQPTPNQNRQDVLWNDIKYLERRNECFSDALGQVSKGAQAIQPSPVPFASGVIGAGATVIGETIKEYGK